MNNIVVIGSGQIGSRHLQALANLDQNQYVVYVLDPSSDALNVAKQRYDEVKKSELLVQYIDTIEKLPSSIAVAIIATGSTIRKSLVLNVLKIKTVKYLVLEKFLFQSMADYSEVQKVLNDKNVSCYVNCARRMWPVYHELKRLICKPIEMQVSGNNWGLGSNGIHLLDIFAFLSEGKNKIEISNHLDNLIQNSKRDGYIEFTGTLQVDNGNGSHLNLTSYPESLSPLLITISNADLRVVIREVGNKVLLTIARLESNWIWEEHVYDIFFQSQLSHLFVQDLILSNTCQLTSYQESAELHLAMLNVFISHYQKSLNKEITLCPIT
jgi:Oxidoreductase family, NAD-binding Rossmann fold